MTLMACAQTQPATTTIPQKYNGDYYQWKGFIETGKGLMFSTGDTNFIPLKPTLLYRVADSSMYFYNTERWKKVGEGAGVVIETDPSVGTHIKNIVTQDITNWNGAYNRRITGTSFDSASAIFRVHVQDGSSYPTTIKFPAQVAQPINLFSSPGASTVSIVPNIGTSAIIAAATSTNAGVLTAADKNRYDAKPDSTVTSQDSILLTYRGGSIVNRDTVRITTPGSNTKINAGSNVTVSGLGTDASPYVISSSGGGGGGTSSESFVAVNDANYTIPSDSTNISVAYKTLTADRTVTIPTASTSVGRIITISHQGSGVYRLNLSAAIEGLTTIYKDGVISFMSDGSVWKLRTTN